jgi:hypothetical protein
MALTNKPRVIIAVTILVIGVIGVGLIAAALVPTSTENNTIRITLLSNAGIMSDEILTDL